MMTLWSIKATQEARSISPSVDELVKATLVEHLYKNIPLLVIIHPLAALLVCFLLKDLYSVSSLALWLSAISAAILVRYILYLSYFKAKPAAGEASVWENFYLLQVVLIALAWSSLGLLFFSFEHTQESSLLVITLLGVSVGSALTHTASARVHTLFSAIVLLPISVKFILEGNSNYIALGGLCLIFIFLLNLYARNIQNQLSNAIKLQFELQQISEELSIEKKKAEAANSSKSRLLAVASHDLRQPAYAIQLLIDSLEAKSSDPSIKPIVNHLKKAAKTLGDLLNGILDLSKIESNLILTKPERIPLSDVFSKIEREYKLRARRKGIKLKIFKTNVWVYSDQLVVERILRNLLDNAISYTQTGGQIILCCRQQADHIRIEVLDNGAGIPSHELSNIFKSFYRLDNYHNKNKQNLGLGLNIASKLARAINTRIVVISKLNRGSKFSFTLENSQEENSQEENSIMSSEQERRQDCISKLSGKLIVAIDDDKMACISMKEYLASYNCACITATNLNELQAKLSACRSTPDLIISAHKLKGEALGPDIIANIRDNIRKEIPAILVTSEHLSEALIQEASTLKSIILQKPVDPDVMCTHVRELITV